MIEEHIKRAFKHNVKVTITKIKLHFVTLHTIQSGTPRLRFRICHIAMRFVRHYCTHFFFEVVTLRGGSGVFSTGFQSQFTQCSQILTGLYHIPYYSPYWALSEKAQNFDTVAMVTTYSLWLAETLTLVLLRVFPKHIFLRGGCCNPPSGLSILKVI